MTFWATLWYAGSVVLTMGYEGQTLQECEALSKLMITDVVTAYDDPSVDMSDTMFPTNEFLVSCETELLPIDEEYMK